ncbi:GL13802 [Drosophila persimilis]|uniref:GL13802 n=1 Tax=Drosophila persimilis TaxID=7234 RepID=B4GP23_DROPE|nr:GL13802 [Drosophila persimilis]
MLLWQGCFEHLSIARIPSHDSINKSIDIEKLVSRLSLKLDWKLGPTLATVNTIVLKPAEQSMCRRQRRAIHPTSYDRFLGELAEASQHCRACHDGEASAIIRARVDGNERLELGGVTSVALDQQSHMI